MRNSDTDACFSNNKICLPKTQQHLNPYNNININETAAPEPELALHSALIEIKADIILLLGGFTGFKPKLSVCVRVQFWVMNT